LLRLHPQALISFQLNDRFVDAFYYKVGENDCGSTSLTVDGARSRFNVQGSPTVETRLVVTYYSDECQQPFYYFTSIDTDIPPSTSFTQSGLQKGSINETVPVVDSLGNHFNVTVSMSWTGVGPPQHVVEHNPDVIAHYEGTARSATVIGSVVGPDGTDYTKLFSTPPQGTIALVDQGFIVKQ
jgi:hypothetical protein